MAILVVYEMGCAFFELIYLYGDTNRVVEISDWSVGLHSEKEHKFCLFI